MARSRWVAEKAPENTAAMLRRLRDERERQDMKVDALAEREGLEFADAEFATSSGAYYRTGPGRGRAMIAKRQPPLRRIFTKAHELAHHLMDEPTQTWIAGTDLQLPNAYRGRARHANHEYFAGCLLMPRHWVGSFMRERGWMLARPDLVDNVARIFGVSASAAEVRLIELGHIERGTR